MPINREHGASDRLLDLLRGPPVHLLIEGTDADGPSPTGDSKLVFEGTPAYLCRSTIDFQNDESRLPDRL